MGGGGGTATEEIIYTCKHQSQKIPWADPGEGVQGIRTPPLLAHYVGFLGPKVGPPPGPPFFACRPKMDPPLLKNPGPAPVSHSFFWGGGGLLGFNASATARVISRR